MRVLYVGSKASGDTDLELTQEITELQRRFGAASAEPVEFHILPDMKVEELPTELGRFRPDILHIASHSDKKALSLSDERGNEVRVTAKMLGAFLPPDPPRVVYLNSCDSKEIAKQLVDLGSSAMAIGSTAPISNRAARAAAVAFYERLLAGFSVARACATAKSMLEALTQSTASMELFPIGGKQAETDIMSPVAALVAEVSNSSANKYGEYGFRLGLYGSPASTAQVTFFTDDETFIEDENSLENDLSLIVRTTPVSGMLWASEDDWWAMGDHRLFAVGVKAGAGCFIVEGTLCKALENRYRLAGSAKLPKTVAEIVEELRKNNGADLSPAAWDSRKSSKSIQSKRLDIKHKK